MYSAREESTLRHETDCRETQQEAKHKQIENLVCKQKVQDKAKSNAYFDFQMFHDFSWKEVLEISPISKFHHLTLNHL